MFAAVPAKFGVVYTGWLLPERKLKELEAPESQLVVIFDDEWVANYAISRGLIMKGKQHACTIYDKGVSLKQCFKCQMYNHITKHCRRHACCAYCAGAHDTGACPNPRDKQFAKCGNCTAENDHIKDPAKKYDAKHFAFSRDCPIRAAHVWHVHQRRT